MDEPTHNISMMVLIFKNYHLWIKEIQKLVNHHKVWEYVDPNEIMKKSDIKRALRVFDYQMKIEETTCQNDDSETIKKKKNTFSKT
jgi:hypothetical protein